MEPVLSTAPITCGAITYRKTTTGYVAGTTDHAGQAVIIGTATGMPGLVNLALVWASCPGAFSRETANALLDVLRRFAKFGVVSPPTRVVSVRGMKPDDVKKNEIVYVGRQHKARDGLMCGKVIYANSKFANPFKIRKDAGKAHRKEVCDAYEKYLRESPGLCAAAKVELRGRALGCWCGVYDGTGETNLECHAVRLAKIAEEL